MNDMKKTTNNDNHDKNYTSRIHNPRQTSPS